MKKGKKAKLITLFLLALVIVLMPVYASAEDEEWIEVKDAKELTDALATGGNIVLTNNVKMPLELNKGVTINQIIVPQGVEATIDLHGWDIDNSYAFDQPSVDGSTIVVQPNAKLTVTDRYNIKRGKITGGYSVSGGGVYLEEHATLTMDGGIISGNVAKGTGVSSGGGVFISKTAEFIMNGGSITNCSAGAGNTASTGIGGGVVVYGSFTMNGGSIYKCGVVNNTDMTRNSSTASGGGVYVTPNATFTMNGGQLGRAEGGSRALKSGGNLYVASKDEAGFGGTEDGKFIFNGGKIVGGDVPLSFDPIPQSGGGGVYNGGVFTMSGDAAIENVTSGDSVFNKGSFTMHGGTISSFESTSSFSGVNIVQGVFDMTGGTITGNSSPNGGGGVCVNGGIFNMSGTAAITENSSSYGGGGVYVSAQGSDNKGVFNMSGGTITENYVTGHSTDPFYGDGNGGGVWIADNGTFNMTGGSITGNRSYYSSQDSEESQSSGTSENYASLGGGVFVDNGGTFNVAGPVTIQDNTVGTSGYVSNVKFYDLSLNTNKLNITGSLTGAAIGITPDLDMKHSITDAPTSSASSIDAFVFKTGENDNVFSSGYTANSGGLFPSAFFTTDVNDETNNFSVVLYSEGETEEAQLLKHTHKWENWTEFDDDDDANTPTKHRRVCSDDSTHVEIAPHVWNDGEVTTSPSETATGIKTYTCTVCGATKTETIPKIDENSWIVSFDSGEGSGEMTAESVTKGKKFRLPVCGFIAPEGKAFDGWQVGENTYASGNDIEVTENITITAQWKTEEADPTPAPTEESWRIQFYVNGGSGNMSADYVVKGNKYRLPVCKFTAPEGKVFSGWGFGSSLYSPGNDIIVNTNITLTALWKDEEKQPTPTPTPTPQPTEETWNVNFAANGGSGQMTAETVVKGNKYRLPVCGFTAPEGMEFSGWDKGAAGSDIAVDADITLTAQWKQIEDDPAPAPGREDQMGTDGTAFGPGAALEAAEAAMAAMTSDEDPEGTTYLPLMLKSTKQTKKSVKLTWKPADGASQYVLYGSKCGAKNKLTKLTAIDGSKTSFNVKKAPKKLKKGSYYKFLLIAVDADNNVVTSSKIAHVATKGSKKNSNNTRVVVKAKVSKTGAALNKYKATSAIALNAGDSTVLKATALKAKGTKVKKHLNIRYESSDASVATVDATGAVTAAKQGTAMIYAIAQNGIAKVVKVTVQ